MWYKAPLQAAVIRVEKIVRRELLRHASRIVQVFVRCPILLHEYPVANIDPFGQYTTTLTCLASWTRAHPSDSWWNAELVWRYRDQFASQLALGLKRCCVFFLSLPNSYQLPGLVHCDGHLCVRYRTATRLVGSESHGGGRFDSIYHLKRSTSGKLRTRIQLSSRQRRDQGSVVQSEVMQRNNARNQEQNCTDWLEYYLLVSTLNYL